MQKDKELISKTLENEKEVLSAGLVCTNKYLLVMLTKWLTFLVQDLFSILWCLLRCPMRKARHQLVFDSCFLSLANSFLMFNFHSVVQHSHSNCERHAVIFRRIKLISVQFLPLVFIFMSLTHQ